MKIAIAETRTLLEAAMRTISFTPPEAAIIADHLLDCELRGLTMGGVSRALSVLELFGGRNADRAPITATRETPFSAALDGGDNIGYLVGRRATEIAIAKAREVGIGVVTAHSAIYSGMLSYYAEMITREGFFGFLTSSAGPFVTPEGGTEARFGTNPVAFGFPSSADPVIWDIGTSRIMVADAFLAQRLGQELAEGVAFDETGTPTTDPMKALAGALRVWGGHKGSGLALCVQLLGVLAGAPAIQDRFGRIGFFLLVLDPQMLTEQEAYRDDVAAFADALRNTRPENPARPVRVPFDRSRTLRAQLLETGEIEVPDEVLAQLKRAIAGLQS